jgi:hypothetical protein
MEEMLVAKELSASDRKETVIIQVDRAEAY